MDIKREFVDLALQPGANRRELCRRFNIGPKAAYALLNRFAQEGAGAFAERSRRPHTSPGKTAAEVESAVLAVREQFPAWGGRKIARVLHQRGGVCVPSASTITAILHRHGQIRAESSQAAEHWHRFEHEQPNALWQIDFKGYFETDDGSRCDALTLLDDHSRFNLAIQVCRRTDTAHVRDALIPVFERYGLPWRIHADNGSPWGTPAKVGHGLSALSVWLIRQGITVTHSTPYHPQTNGKLERFHRSLKAEVLSNHSFADPAQVQRAFDRWRTVYNHLRPHESLGDRPPISRYKPSSRRYSAQLPAIEYAPNDIVLQVKDNGWVKFQGRRIRMSAALYRLPIAFRPVPDQDGSFDVFFCHQAFMRLDLRTLQPSD